MLLNIRQVFRVNSFKCIHIFLTHILGIWYSIWSIIYILSTHIKYKAITVIPIQVGIEGILVTKLIRDVKLFLIQFHTVSKMLPVEFSTTCNNSSDKLSLSKLKLDINS